MKNGEKPNRKNRKDAAKTAFAILNGEKYEEAIYEDVFFIDADNVEMYGADGWQ